MSATATPSAEAASSEGPYELDVPFLRRGFDRAAASFDAAAVLHTAVRNELLQRLDLVAIDPRVVLDVGSGTGACARALIRRYRNAHTVAIDVSMPMLKLAADRRIWRRRFDRVCAAAEGMPLPDASVDLIVSNLMLPWCNPDAVLAEFLRVLTPQGLVSFTTLGPDTLRELRQAWQSCDSAIHVHRFLDMHDLGSALVRAGFNAPVLDVERFTLSYRHVRAVAADLRATGARNAAAGRRKGLTGPRRFAAMQAAYEESRAEGRLPATVEVIFAHAWAPAAQRRSAPGEDAHVSLEEIKRQLRIRRPP